MLVEGLLVLTCGGSGLGAGLLFIIAVFFCPSLLTYVGFAFGIFIWSLIIAAIWSVFRFFFPSKAQKKEWKEEYERQRKAGMFYTGL